MSSWFPMLSSAITHQPNVGIASSCWRSLDSVLSWVHSIKFSSYASLPERLPKGPEPPVYWFYMVSHHGCEAVSFIVFSLLCHVTCWNSQPKPPVGSDVERYTWSCMISFKHIPFSFSNVSPPQRLPLGTVASRTWDVDWDGRWCQGSAGGQ